MKSNLTIDETIQHADDLIKLGKHTLAKQALRELLTRKNLTSKHKLNISGHFLRLYDIPNAIKILGKILDLGQLKHASIDNLILQLQIALIYDISGGRYVSSQMIRNIETEAERRKIDLSLHWPEYTFNLGNYYWGQNFYEKSLNYFQKAAHNTNISEYQQKVAKLGICDNLEALGNSKEAIQKITDLIKNDILDNEVLLKAVLIQARGEYYLRDNQLSKAKQDFDHARNIFPRNTTENVDHYYMWNGIYFHMSNGPEKAKECFSQALNIIQEKNGWNKRLIELFYWIEKNNSKEVSLTQKIASRCHPTFSPYSFLLGKKALIGQQQELSKWLKERYIDTEFDCWIITNRNINPIKYSEFNSLKHNRKILDLVSGCIIQKNETAPLITLSKIQSLCLTGIIASGSLGISRYSLVDFIYRENFISLDMGSNRLKELIKRLRNDFDIKIIRDDNIFYYNFTNDYDIILDMQLQCANAFLLFKKNFTYFTRKDLENYFSLKSTASKDMLKKWRQSGIVIVHDQGKITKYSFV